MLTTYIKHINNVVSTDKMSMRKKKKSRRPTKLVLLAPQEKIYGTKYCTLQRSDQENCLNKYVANNILDDDQ